jgi:Ca-activated chloride channel homolog
MWNFEFLHPYFLFLIPIFFFLLAILFFQTRKKMTSFSAFADLKAVYKNHSFFYFLFLGTIFFIFTLFCFLFADPRIINIKEKESKNGIDIAIVLDVSYSMETADLKPNRIEVAKKVIYDFLDKIRTDRVGIILFAGKPFTSVPLTFDYGFLKQFIQNTNTEIIDQRNFDLQGTAIGDALILGNSLLEKDEQDKKREKIIILLTDGSANKWINPDLALKLSLEKNIKVYTIWVWGLEQTSLQIIDSFWGVQNIQIDGIDEKALKKIASTTGGEYYRATSLSALESIFQTISKLEKRKIETSKLKTSKEMYDIFVYLLLFSFWILFFLHFKNLKI